jgi:hypothetical protein
VKVKIQFDLGEALRHTTDSVYETTDRLFENLSMDLSEPGAVSGDVRLWARGTEQTVGFWEIV